MKQSVLSVPDDSTKLRDMVISDNRLKSVQVIYSDISQNRCKDITHASHTNDYHCYKCLTIMVVNIGVRILYISHKGLQAVPILI